MPVVLGCLLAATSAFARAAGCDYSPMTFDATSSRVVVGSYTVTLSNPDSTAAPTVWEGPLIIEDGQSGKTCTVDQDGLVDHPLFSFDHRFLVVVTKSGSNFRTVTVDLQECRVTGASAKMTGPITFDNGQVVVAGSVAEGLGAAPCAVK
jgi:hypothetical protein